MSNENHARNFMNITECAITDAFYGLVKEMAAEELRRAWKGEPEPNCLATKSSTYHKLYRLYQMMMNARVDIIALDPRRPKTRAEVAEGL